MKQLIFVVLFILVTFIGFLYFNLPSVFADQLDYYKVLTPHDGAAINLDGTNNPSCGILFSWNSTLGHNIIFVRDPKTGTLHNVIDDPNDDGKSVVAHQVSFSELFYAAGISISDIPKYFGQKWGVIIYAHNSQATTQGGESTFTLVRGNSSKDGCGFFTTAPSCTSLGGVCQYSGCTNGALNGSCSSGYMQCCKPTPSSDPCANVPDTNSANGWYCANATANNFATNSNDTNHLYDCEHSKAAQTRDCSNLGGCIINQNGNDYCKDDNGGGNGSCSSPSTYTECTWAGSGCNTYLGHVPVGHTAQVHTCNGVATSCDDLGPCSNGTSCTNGKDTQIALSVKLDGIGTTTFENNNPKTPTKQSAIRVYDPSAPTTSVVSSSSTVTFGKSDGKFSGSTIDLKTTLSCSTTYKVDIKFPGYLPATADIKYGDTTQVISVEPIPGDINQVDNNGIIIGDGKIDINDYSLFRQCRNVSPTTTIAFQSGSKTVNVACSSLVNFFDFQDGGTMETVLTPAGIGEWDANYNLWLRSYIKANGL